MYKEKSEQPVLHIWATRENLSDIWGLGGGGGFNNQTGLILVQICLLSYINLHVKYGPLGELSPSWFVSILSPISIYMYI